MNQPTHVLLRGSDRFDAAVWGPWFRESRGSVFCTECRDISPEWKPRPIDIVLSQLTPSRGSLGIVAICGVTVIRRSLLALLAPPTDRHVVGRCIMHDGRELEDYCTCYTLSPQIWYGASYEYRTCPVCRTHDTVLVKEPFRILSSLTNEPVMQNTSGVFIVMQKVASRVNWRQYPDVVRSPVFSTLEQEPKI